MLLGASGPVAGGMIGRASVSRRGAVAARTRCSSGAAEVSGRRCETPKALSTPTYYVGTPWRLGQPSLGSRGCARQASGRIASRLAATPSLTRGLIATLRAQCFLHTALGSRYPVARSVATGVGVHAVAPHRAAAAMESVERRGNERGLGVGRGVSLGSGIADQQLARVDREGEREDRRGRNTPNRTLPQRDAHRQRRHTPNCIAPHAGANRHGRNMPKRSSGTLRAGSRSVGGGEASRDRG